MDIQNVIELEHQVLEVVFLCETKILYFLEDVQAAVLFDITNLFCQKLDIQHDFKNRFIINMEMTTIAIYHNQKRTLMIYDIINKAVRQLNLKFRLVGCFKNEIIGIKNSQGGLSISFDCYVTEFQLPMNKIKKNSKIQLIGNRLLTINKNKFYLIKMNQTNRYEMKGIQKLIIQNRGIDLVKTGKSIYYLMTHCKGYYVFKNCQKFKTITSRIHPFTNLELKIVGNIENKVVIRITGLLDLFYVVQLKKPKTSILEFYKDKVSLNKLINWKYVAKNGVLIIWNENSIFFFNL